MSSYANRPEWIFRTYPEKLSSMLEAIDKNKYVLPEFQRNWVWEPENIKELLISVTQSFPAGSLLMLKYHKKTFKVRYFEGVRNSPTALDPEFLVLDGQQRLTSLYQTLYLKDGVKINRTNGQVETYYFYFNLFDLMNGVAMEKAIFYVKEDKMLKEGGEVKFDLSTRRGEFEYGCLPLTCIFDISERYDEWRDDFTDYHVDKGTFERRELREKLREINEQFIRPVKNYEFPVIELHQDTPLPAICHIFEKVNTAGVMLTVFELLTAVLWANEIDLRTMWKQTQEKLSKVPNLEGLTIDSIAFLQALSLLVTYNDKMNDPERGYTVSCLRDDLLELGAEDINKYWNITVDGFKKAADVLFENGISATLVLPYTAMLTPLAAMVAIIQQTYGKIEPERDYEKIKRWFWMAIFTQRYSSDIENRAAVDFQQVLYWIRDEASVPDVVKQAVDKVMNQPAE